MFLHVPPSMTRDFSLSSLKWIVFSFRKKLSTFLFISKPERNPLRVSVKHRRFMFLKWAFGGLAMFSWSGESSVEKKEEDLGAMLRLKWAHWSGINSFQLIESNINNKEVWKLIRRSQYFYPIHIPNRKLLTPRELKWQLTTCHHIPIQSYAWQNGFGSVDTGQFGTQGKTSKIGCFTSSANKPPASDLDFSLSSRKVDIQYFLTSPPFECVINVWFNFIQTFQLGIQNPSHSFYRQGFKRDHVIMI